MGRPTGSHDRIRVSSGVRAPGLPRSGHRVARAVGAAALAFVLVDAASAATAPDLGAAEPFGVASSTFTNSNTAPQTIINGDVCYTTPPTTFPLTINGTITTPCAPAVGVAQGQALANLLGQACTSLGPGDIALDAVVIGANPPGVFPPGCYSSGGAMNVTLSTTVTLSGGGVYIFRPGGALNTGDNSTVLLENNACASNVFWAPVGATTLGANAALSLTPTFVGNIIDAAGITIGHFAHLSGRALAFGGTVTTDANTISVPTCAAIGPPLAVPALAAWAMMLLAALMAAGGFVAIGRRRRQAWHRGAP